MKIQTFQLVICKFFWVSFTARVTAIESDCMLIIVAHDIPVYLALL